MGANQGRTKGNKQEAEYLKAEGKHGKPGWNGSGGARKLKGGGAAPKKTYCEGETGRERKGRNRGQVARTGREADERKRIGREKTESESIR